MSNPSQNQSQWYGQKINGKQVGWFPADHVQLKSKIGLLTNRFNNNDNKFNLNVVQYESKCYPNQTLTNNSTNINQNNVENHKLRFQQDSIIRSPSSIGVKINKKNKNQ